MKEITSTQNSYIKNLIKLKEKSRERNRQGVFLIEGKREIDLAVKSNYEIDTILFYPNLFPKDRVDTLTRSNPSLISVNKEVYEKLAYRDTTEGVLAVAKVKNHQLSELKFTKENPLILVAEGIEKPGNLGALFRTADAANVDAVLIADARTDVYNPNIIRSSVGCVFTHQIGVSTSEEIIGFLNAHQIQIFSATLQNSNAYHLEDYTQASAIVVGTEAAGLTELWRKQATQNINIPMQGKIDSMNVSVAAAIIIFEAKRQRKFK